MALSIIENALQHTGINGINHRVSVERIHLIARLFVPQAFRNQRTSDLLEQIPPGNLSKKRLAAT